MAKPKRGSKKYIKKKDLKIKKDLVAEYKDRIEKDKIVSVVRLGDDNCLANVRLHISTQSLGLDVLLNNGGIPCGRVTEIYGPWHIGKSTLLDHCLAEVQRIGGVGILIDTEGARDIAYSSAIGIDPKKLHYLDFSDGELNIENIISKIIETIQFWKNTDTPVLIGWDALAGTATRDEVVKRFDQNRQPAQASKIMREACRQIPEILGNTKIAVVLCNHEYEKINMHGVGKKRETYGGAGLRHLSSIRLELFSVGEWIKNATGEPIGRVIGGKLVKNRLGKPWGQARFALLAGVGIDNIWSIYYLFKQAGYITISGSWAAMNIDGEVMKFQGWSGLVAKCAEDSTLFPRLVNIYKSIAS